MTDPDLVETKARDAERVERTLARLRGVGELMDDKFELPIVKVKVGLDPLLGLIPGGGDWISWVASIYIIVEAARLGVPARLLARMSWNVSVDLIGGYVPGLGDVFDVFYKANRRNVDLLLDHFDATLDSSAPGVVEVPREALERSRGGALTRWAVASVLILVSFGLAALPFVLIGWLVRGA